MSDEQLFARARRNAAKMRYVAIGSPYGDDDAGFARWLAEQGETPPPEKVPVALSEKVPPPATDASARRP